MFRLAMEPRSVLVGIFFIVMIYIYFNELDRTSIPNTCLCGSPLAEVKTPPQVPSPEQLTPSVGIDLNANKPCKLNPRLSNYPIDPKINHAFSVVTNSKLPRAYNMGYETFFYNNPNATLYIIGSPSNIDPRFEKHGFKIVMMPLEIKTIITKLLEEIPELDVLVFNTAEWTNHLLPNINSTPMAYADFMRISLLYLYGGTWIDADAIYLKAFTFKNAIPCHQKIDYDAPSWLQCDDDGNSLAYDRKRPYIKDQTFYCTNGILGGFDPGHPFLKKVLKRISIAHQLAKSSYLRFALGGHLFVDALSNTSLRPHPLRVQLDEWPNLYDLDRMFGFFWIADLSSKFPNDANLTRKMIDDVYQREVYSIQIYGANAFNDQAMINLFENGSFHHQLWMRNCIFSCQEPAAYLAPIVAMPVPLPIPNTTRIGLQSPTP